MRTAKDNPALQAAKGAMEKLTSCIERQQSFVFEAGAGAGKTFSLIEALNSILKHKSRQFEQLGQQVACITYTNIAKDQIIQRTDNNPLVFASTLHGFCWELIKGFQKELLNNLPSIKKWAERIDKYDIPISNQSVQYDDMGYPSIKEDVIQLYHDDILELASLFLQEPKFWKLLGDRFPIIFIDEYQDTKKILSGALIEAFDQYETGPLFGFFGDHWQRIYSDGMGEIASEKLIPIEKGANFRSVDTIVQYLNNLRPKLKQASEDPTSTGFLKAYHTNDWNCERRSDNHWKGDLLVEDADNALSKMYQTLKKNGWDLSPEKTKVLMLTHNVLASRQGYDGIAKLFPSNSKSAYTKKEHAYIKFLCEVVEPFCRFYSTKKFGKMFSVEGVKRPKIESMAEKQSWVKFLDTLIKLRETGTIGTVISHLKSFSKFNLPAKILLREKELESLVDLDPEDEVPSRLSTILKLKEVPYQEISKLYEFVEEKTLFSTQHGVKGAQFENVLVVLGGGWNHYNFDKYLAWESNGLPTKEKEIKTYERNRNLFYVACSRPKKRLALLFTQELSPSSIETLGRWMGKNRVLALPKE